MTAIISRNPSVVLTNNQATTTSTAVAEYFGKNHRHVLRAIDNLIAEMPEETHQRNFGQMFRKVEIGQGAMREFREFTLTRDGFALLAMGFTGKEAMQWKIAYLEAFNKMEAALKAEAFAPTVINPAQQNTLQQIVAFKSGESGGLRAYCWSRFNNHFHLGSYKQLPAAYFDEAVAYLETLPMKKEPALPAPVTSPLIGQRILTRLEEGGRYTTEIVPADAYVLTLASFEELLKRAGKAIVPLETVNAIRKLQLVAA